MEMHVIKHVMVSEKKEYLDTPSEWKCTDNSLLCEVKVMEPDPICPVAE